MRKILLILGVAMALTAVTATSAIAMRPDHKAKHVQVTVPDEDASPRSPSPSTRGTRSSGRTTTRTITRS